MKDPTGHIVDYDPGEPPDWDGEEPVPPGGELAAPSNPFNNPAGLLAERDALRVEVERLAEAHTAALNRGNDLYIENERLRAEVADLRQKLAIERRSQ